MEEMINFIEDIEELVSVAQTIPNQQFRFNPNLFYLWKISKSLEEAKQMKTGEPNADIK